MNTYKPHSVREGEDNDACIGAPIYFLIQNLLPNFFINLTILGGSNSKPHISLTQNLLKVKHWFVRRIL